MRIFDCFCYNGERKLLDIRMDEFKLFTEVNKHISVIHIAVESKFTFTGIQKPININGNGVNFFCDYEEVPFLDPWENERRLRNRIKPALMTFMPLRGDDVIIISDVDEIPRVYAIQHYKPEYGLCALQMDIHQYYLNTILSRQSWYHARIMPWHYLKDKEPNDVRNSGFNLALVNAGWHFQWMGGTGEMMRKFKSFSHQEPDTQAMADYTRIEDKVSRLEHLWNHDKLSIVTDESLPYNVWRNKEKYKEMLK